MSEFCHLGDADVAALLPDPASAVDLAARALRLRADGSAQVPPKPQVTFGENAFANAMRTSR